MYIDFHTHILPRTDDGAKNLKMSLKMLNVAKSSGAETVVLTPHISALADFNEFLRFRDKRHKELISAIHKRNTDAPEILLGAEVMLDGLLSERENVCSLCIEGTNVLLLELPYTHWNKNYAAEIKEIIKKHDVVPVIAHIERYIKRPKDVKKLEPLAALGVKFQVNASSVMSFSGKRVFSKLLSQKLICAIASDAHGLAFRSPDISTELLTFSKIFGAGALEEIYNKSYNLLKNSSTPKGKD